MSRFRFNHDYGKSISVTRIRNLAGTDSLGTTAKGIHKAASMLNMSCKAMLSREKEFNSDFNSPIVCQIKRDGLEHYIEAENIRILSRA